MRWNPCGWRSVTAPGSRILLGEVSPLTASLDRFVKLDKGDFIGRTALLAEKQQGSRQRFVPLVVDAGTADAPFAAPVWHNGSRVGFVSSAGYGFRIKKAIALAFVDAELSSEGTALELEVLGERVPAVVASEPLFDPKNERLRT